MIKEMMEVANNINGTKGLNFNLGQVQPRVWFSIASGPDALHSFKACIKETFVVETSLSPSNSSLIHSPKNDGVQIQ